MQPGAFAGFRTNTPTLAMVRLLMSLSTLVYLHDIFFARYTHHDDEHITITYAFLFFTFPTQVDRHNGLILNLTV